MAYYCRAESGLRHQGGNRGADKAAPVPLGDWAPSLGGGPEREQRRSPRRLQWRACDKADAVCIHDDLEVVLPISGWLEDVRLLCTRNKGPPPSPSWTVSQAPGLWKQAHSLQGPGSCSLGSHEQKGSRRECLIVSVIGQLSFAQLMVLLQDAENSDGARSRSKAQSTLTSATQPGEGGREGEHSSTAGQGPEGGTPGSQADSLKEPPVG